MDRKISGDARRQRVANNQQSMSNSLSDTLSTLNKLIETCLDGQEGFRLAAEAITDDEDLKGFLFSASLQRSKFAGELQLAAQKPPARSAGQVYSDVQSSLKAKGQAFGASASEGWTDVRAKTDDVLHQTEVYVRENPFPAIVTALGVGFALGLLVRLLETPSRAHIEVPIPKAAQKVRDFDYQAAVLPFLWPVVKFFSSSYAASRKSVNKAYKQASDIDVSDYIDPVVKKAKKFF